jgi:hypothetical protein
VKCQDSVGTRGRKYKPKRQSGPPHYSLTPCIHTHTTHTVAGLRCLGSSWVCRCSPTTDCNASNRRQAHQGSMKSHQLRPSLLLAALVALATTAGISAFVLPCGSRSSSSSRAGRSRLGRAKGGDRLTQADTSSFPPSFHLPCPNSHPCLSHSRPPHGCGLGRLRPPQPFRQGGRLVFPLGTDVVACSVRSIRLSVGRTSSRSPLPSQFISSFTCICLHDFIS